MADKMAKWVGLNPTTTLYPTRYGFRVLLASPYLAASTVYCPITTLHSRDERQYFQDVAPHIMYRIGGWKSRLTYVFNDANIPSDMGQLLDRKWLQDWALNRYFRKIVYLKNRINSWLAPLWHDSGLTHWHCRARKRYACKYFSQNASSVLQNNLERCYFCINFYTQQARRMIDEKRIIWLFTQRTPLDLRVMSNRYLFTASGLHHCIFRRSKHKSWKWNLKQSK